MKNIFLFALLSALLFPIGGTVVFYDGTTIEGDIKTVSTESVYMIPIGLSFPEEILMENVDSLKLYDGELMVADNQIILLYSNGEFISPEKAISSLEGNYDYDVEYVIIPNWSLNIYTGYPIIRAESLSDTYYDDINPVYGLSLGSPYGLFMGDFFMNLITEIAYYNFTKKSGEANVPFDGLAYQIGLSPGFFIGEASVSLTLCTGLYHAGSGFIAGGSIDLPLGGFITSKFSDYSIVDNFEDQIEALEIRLTSRSNIIQKKEGGSTYWADLGISFGYEF